MGWRGPYWSWLRCDVCGGCVTCALWCLKSTEESWCMCAVWWRVVSCLLCVLGAVLCLAWCGVCVL